MDLVEFGILLDLVESQIELFKEVDESGAGSESWCWELVELREMKGESREAEFLHCHLLTQGKKGEDALEWGWRREADWTSARSIDFKVAAVQPRGYKCLDWKDLGHIGMLGNLSRSSRWGLQGGGLGLQRAQHKQTPHPAWSLQSLLWLRCFLFTRTRPTSVAHVYTSVKLLQPSSFPSPRKGKAPRVSVIFIYMRNLSTSSITICLTLLVVYKSVAC